MCALTPTSPAAAPPTLGAEGAIVEGVVTTLDETGRPHVAPMGPIVDATRERLWLRPFRTSTTFANLKRSRVGVFHVTDDVELIARAAVGDLRELPTTTPAARIRGMVLADACQWYEFEVESLDDAAERASLVARVVARGVGREFFGFNRAKHAVLEAAILATRVHLIAPQQLRDELARLQSPVAKTGAAAERRAFDFLCNYVDAQLAAHAAGAPPDAKATAP